VTYALVIAVAVRELAEREPHAMVALVLAVGRALSMRWRRAGVPRRQGAVPERPGLSPRRRTVTAFVR
jgi:hypothetical protein